MGKRAIMLQTADLYDIVLLHAEINFQLSKSIKTMGGLQRNNIVNRKLLQFRYRVNAIS